MITREISFRLKFQLNDRRQLQLRGGIGDQGLPYDRRR